MIWNIVSDSSSDLLTSDFKDDNIRFESVPLRIQVGEREFMDDETLNVPEMLQSMAAEKTAASTACPSPAAFARAFEQGDRTICFTISGKLSGTYNAAVLGRDMVLEEHPDKRILVMDSKSTAGAMILLIRKAKELIQADVSDDFKGICDKLREYQSTLRTVFTLENYDNLIKNGRMRPLVGTLLHTLGIHVIADGTPEGTIHVADKARGEAKTYKGIIKRMCELKDCTDATVVINHCENREGALKLKEQIQKDLSVKSVDIVSCRGLTSFYALEKGLIVCF